MALARKLDDSQAVPCRLGLHLDLGAAADGVNDVLVIERVRAWQAGVATGEESRAVGLWDERLHLGVEWDATFRRERAPDARVLGTRLREGRRLARRSNSVCLLRVGAKLPERVEKRGCQ